MKGWKAPARIALVAGIAAWVVAARVSAQEAADARQLVESLGCGACHAGVPEAEAIRAVAPPFGDGAALLASAYIFHYMDDPQTVRPNIAPARDAPLCAE